MVSFNCGLYSTIDRGAQFSSSYRIFFRNENGPISPLHDIPLYHDATKKVFNMIVEIPRWTNAKMEISRDEALNPIKQDVKNNKPRFVANCFPYHGYIWNYGALPQTWENPEHIDENTGAKGDNDPIDVLEIGYRKAKCGEILQVKILGTIAVIDEGETDWKLIAIDINDPMADSLNDIVDVEREFPGLLNATIDWFTIYKVPDGKPANKIAFNNRAKSADYALNIVKEVHNFWKELINKRTDNHNISLTNTTVANNSSKISSDDASNIIHNTPTLGTRQSTPALADKWHFIRRQRLVNEQTPSPK